MLKSNRWLVLTPSPYFNPEFIRNLPHELAAAFRQGRDEVAERMKVIVRSGVRFAVGTDAMHGDLARDIQYLVEWGASESVALMAATRHAAAVLGLEESVGTLEPGKTADLVGLKGNPLQDIRALGRVRTVICRGTLFYFEAKGIN